MHYLHLAQEIADDLAWKFDDVIDDLLAVVARHNWNPSILTSEQADTARFETIARAETVNDVLGLQVESEKRSRRLD